MKNIVKNTQKLLLVLALALLPTTHTALAAQTAPATGKADVTVEPDVSITPGTLLSFGKLIVKGTANNVHLDPDGNGTIDADNNIIVNTPGSVAEFVISGAPKLPGVSITFANEQGTDTDTITLSTEPKGKGSTTSLTLEADTGSQNTFSLGENGQHTVKVGGTLDNLPKESEETTYTGTYTIKVNY